jgi:hypothetical protein
MTLHNNNDNEISSMLSSLIEEKKYKNTHPQQQKKTQLHPIHHSPFHKAIKKTKKNRIPNIPNIHNATFNSDDTNHNDNVNNDETDETDETLSKKYDEIKHLAKQLNLQPENMVNGSPEYLKQLINNIQDYLEIDKTYLLKHNELKKLYQSYIESYKQNNSHMSVSNMSGSVSNMSGSISNMSGSNASNDLKHKDIVKTIHSEMKDNNSDLYKGRLMILKKIKEEPHIEPIIKNKLCGHLLAIFKRPPNSEYKQLPMLSQSNEKIAISELDNAYMTKHNELMIVYKAYQKLFNKVLNYKDVIEQYKKLPTSSSITRNHMDKLVSDQSFVMNMIDKMQDKLVDQNIISNTEKVPIHPVTSHPENIQTFNDTMKKQIDYIVESQTPIQPKLKKNIDKVLTEYRDCSDTTALCCKSNYNVKKNVL